MDLAQLSHVSSCNGSESDAAGPTYVGFICAGVAVVFFGSNFVPVKTFESGDGMFFQWVLCSSIWCVGLCVNAIRHFPVFYPLAMLGGFLWATGNIMVVPIIKMTGLGQGILIWGSFNLLAGWASGRYGWFGLKPRPPCDTALSYAGLGMCIISTFIYILIKSNVHGTENEQMIPRGLLADDDEPLLQANNTSSVNAKESVLIENQDESMFDRLSPVRKRIGGTVMAVISGLLYGFNFAPVIYVQDNYKDASQNGMDYVFAHYSGIYITSCVYFLAYCGYMKNRPRLYSSLILPAYASGLMWAIAATCWFEANAILSEPISFPIITTGPGIIASLWAVFVFKEITGFRNFVILGVAFLFTIAGGVMTGLSKK